MHITSIQTSDSTIHFPWRRPVAGILILIMTLVTIATGLFDFEFDFNLSWVAGTCGWLAAFLLFPDTPKILRIQAGVIIFTGISLGIYAVFLGGKIQFDTIVSGNTGLLSMIAAVGFLRLVAIPDSSQKEALPIGTIAYIQTLLGLNISSSVINISAPILIADRIHSVRPLQRFTAQSMIRVFCAASNWSPFFGAMAVVLTYIGDAQLSWIIMAGVPFTLLGLLVVFTEARFRYRSEVEQFVGYPMHLQSLMIPMLLVIAVVSGSWLLPSVPILVVISLSALLITCIVLLFRGGLRESILLPGRYVVEGLPRIVNELTLFLAAALIAAGMSALIQQGIVPNPFTSFDASTASMLLGFMLLLAAIGVHPVILISSLSPLMLTLEPDPNLLAITYLMAWNLGTGSSPLSGTNLVFQGRYNISSWKIAMWNWPYALLMYGFAVLWLQVLDRNFL